ncbi:MAG TPA: GFA family protein [Gammaproteobacteria bacterium]
MLRGSCLCGGLRYEARGEPLFQGFCQCLDCRKVGCGHYAAIGMPEQAVTITGEYRAFAKKGDSGKLIYRHFCPTCGGMAFDKGEAMPGVVIINAALLEDPELFKPTSVIYASRALPWDHLDPGLPRFETMPANG